MGLAMGFGLIIDNAVVVLENVYRHARTAPDAEAAAERGAREMVLPVLAATLTTIIVFVPFVYLQGEVRLFYVPLAIVVGLTAPLLSVPATFATFLVSQSVLSREQLDTSLDQPGVARAVLGSALYLTAVGLLGLGLGALLRNTAGAIASLFGVLFGLQIVVGFLPATLADMIARYLPTPAGVAVTNVRPDPASLGPWAGFGLFCLYTAVVLGLAAWLLRRRDV